MAAPITLADGQVAASAATIFSATSVNEGRVTLTLCNTAGTAETVVVTLSRAGGTARRIARAVLNANEMLVVSGQPVQAGDVVAASTTNASAVDYVVTGGGADSLTVYCLDANGALKSGAAAIGSGNLTISGDLTVSGGDIDAGASGAAGSVDVFPSTASKGKLSFTAADSTGDTTTTIVNAEQSGARTYTIPDAGASASFVMTAGAQTLAGVKTFTSVPVVNPATGTAGGIDLKSTTDNTGTFRLVAADSAGDTVTTVTHASQAGARTYTIPDAGASASFVMTEGSQTVNGTKTIAALVTTNLDAGASGTAGSIDIFPTTTAKGKVAITCTDQAGDTTVSLTIGAMAAARAITLADPLADADILTGKMSAVARTATADGLTTGTVAAAGLLQFITVTSADANHIVVLPTPTPGRIVVLCNGGTGYELRTSDPANIAINGGSGAAAESAIAASTMVIAVCKTATAWAAFSLAGTTLAAVEAAA